MEKIFRVKWDSPIEYSRLFKWWLAKYEDVQVEDITEEYEETKGYANTYLISHGKISEIADIQEERDIQLNKDE